MNDFDGLVALVTGAGSGIGQATAIELQARGARVAGLDIDPEGIPEGVLALKADLTDQDAVSATIEETVAAHGRLDVLVNNAGIGATGTIEDNSDEEWHHVFDVNVVSMARTCRAALKHLRQSPSGVIVNVASLYATTGMPNRVCYSASKGAVMALTLAMAADLAPERIRVNCVCPGSTDTPWVRRLLDGVPNAEKVRAKSAARLPMGARGRPDELAYAIAFCASPRNGYLTGAVLGVDGGMSTLRLPGKQ